MPIIPYDSLEGSHLSGTGVSLDGTFDVNTFDLADRTSEKILLSISENGGCDINVPCTYHMQSDSLVPLTVLNEEGDITHTICSNGDIFTIGNFVMHNITLTYTILSSLVSNYMNYVTNSSLAQTLLNYVTETFLTQTLEDYPTNEDVADTLTAYTTNQELTQTLTNYPTHQEVVTVLEDYAMLESANFQELKVLEKDVATQEWVLEQDYVTTDDLNGTVSDINDELQNYALLNLADFQELKVQTKPVATQDWVSNQSYATQSWVTDQNYATQTWVTDKNYATQTWVQNQDYASKSWVQTQDYVTQPSLNTTLTNYVSQTSLTANNSSLTSAYTTADTALSTSLTSAYTAADSALAATLTTAYTAAIATSSALTTSNVEAWVTLQNYATQTWVTNKNYLTTLPSTANFTSLTVNNTAVLTSLPSTANFTSLTISNNTVATQQWVTDKSYATATSLGDKTVNANFLTLKVNDVSVTPSSYMTLGGAQVLSSDVTSTSTYKFLGALPSEIAYLSGVTSAIQTQLNNRVTTTSINNASLNADFTALKVSGNSVIYYNTDTNAMKAIHPTYSGRGFFVSLANPNASSIRFLSNDSSTGSYQYDSTITSTSGTTINNGGTLTYQAYSHSFGGSSGTGGSVTISLGSLTISVGNLLLGTTTLTPTILGRLVTVSSDVQTQIDSKANTSSLSNYALLSGATFTGGLNVSNGTTNNFTVDTSGNVTIKGTLTVTGNETEQADLSVTGKITINNPLSVNTFVAPTLSTQIGYNGSVTNAFNISLTNSLSSYSQVCSLTLSAGVYMLFGTVHYNGTGSNNITTFAAAISNINTGMDSLLAQNHLGESAANALFGNVSSGINGVCLNCQRIVSVSSSQTYYLMTCATFSSTLTIPASSSGLQYVRIA